MKKLKYIYAVNLWLKKMGTFGIQYMKGDNAKQAKERFKKRFPSKTRRVLSAERIEEPDYWQESSAL